MLVTVARYSLPYEAQLGRAKLESEGIPAFVADEHTINMQWLYSNALGGVRLQVPEEFKSKALELLNEENGKALIEQQGVDSIPCPKCGSENTEYYQFGRRWAFLVFLGINFPLFPVKNGIKCNDCGQASKT